MPITKDEFMRGRRTTELEQALVAFLKSHPGTAYSQSELQAAVFQPTENVFQDLANFLAIGGTLDTLVKERRVLKKQVNLVDHYLWNTGGR